MALKAYDYSGRTVYFSESCASIATDSFLAFSADGAPGYYRIRHRRCGPAIHKGEKREWFVYGRNVTKKVEAYLASIANPFKAGSKDFTLDEKVCKRMIVLGVLA